MKKQIKVKINRSQFEKDCKIVADIYNMIILLSSFCKLNNNIEEIANIIPVIEYLKNESDKLCFNFLNLQYMLQNRNFDKK